MCGPFISTSVDHSLGNRGHSGKDLLVLGLGEALSVWRGKVGGEGGDLGSRTEGAIDRPGIDV